MSDTTLRYRSSHDTSYALALVALLDYARKSEAQFVFGPMRLEALRNEGLVVTSQDVSVDDLARILESVPGLFLGEA